MINDIFWKYNAMIKAIIFIVPSEISEAGKSSVVVRYPSHFFYIVFYCFWAYVSRCMTKEENSKEKEFIEEKKEELGDLPEEVKIFILV